MKAVAPQWRLVHHDESRAQTRIEHMLALEELWRRTPGTLLYLVFVLIRLSLSKDKEAVPPAAQV